MYKTETANLILTSCRHKHVWKIVSSCRVAQQLFFLVVPPKLHTLYKPHQMILYSSSKINSAAHNVTWDVNNCRGYPLRIDGGNPAVPEMCQYATGFWFCGSRNASPTTAFFSYLPGLFWWPGRYVLCTPLKYKFYVLD